MEKIRYSRLSDIIDLLFFMGKKPLGVTISEIQSRYQVSRRTAVRMKDSLTNVLCFIGELENSGIEKHWGFQYCKFKDFFPIRVNNYLNKRMEANNE